MGRPSIYTYLYTLWGEVSPYAAMARRIEQSEKPRRVAYRLRR